MTKYENRYDVVNTAFEIINGKAGNAENGYDWDRKMSIREIHDWMIQDTKRWNRIADCEEDIKALPTMADTVIALKVLELACEVEGNMSEGYGIHTMLRAMQNHDLWILDEDELSELDAALDGYEARFGTVREWLNATAPKTMKKLETRKAKVEEKLAKFEAKRKAEEKAYWDSMDEEEAA